MLPPKPEPKGKGRGKTYNQFKEKLRKARGIYACEQCRAIVDSLEGHHIVRVHDDPNREYDPTNIRFLCPVCHKAQHTIGSG